MAGRRAVRGRAAARARRPRRLAAALVVAALGAAVTATGLQDGQIIARFERIAVLVAEGEPTPTPAPPARPWPTPIASRPLSRELVPGAPRQLTAGQCCPGAWWSADSAVVQFLDAPAPDAGVAIMGVPVWPPGAPLEVVDTQVALRADEHRFLVRPVGGYSLVKDVRTGVEWPLPTGGNPVRLSPDGSRAVWWEADGGREHIDSLVSIFAAGIDGADVRELTTLWAADVVSFLPDNARVLVTGRPIADQPVYLLGTLEVATGRLVQLARGSWLSDAALSADGGWVAYMVSLDRADPADNGLWAVPTGGGEPRRLPFVGAYRWRDGQRLVYVPMELGGASHSVWQLDVETGEAVRLLDPAAAPLRIANNEWSVSPDGLSLVYRSETDRNLWVVDLPTDG